MTMIRARVHRRFEVHPLGYDRDAQPWVARVYFNDAPDYKRTATAGSQPEAMLQAYKLMADLDAELMEQVHASRATRRTEQTIAMFIENGHPTELEATR